jgi:hypothetical protein
MAGVPYTYQMLLQTGLLEKRGSTLQTVTQAGGGLAEPLVRKLHELAQRRGLRFFRYVRAGLKQPREFRTFLPRNSVKK